MYKLLNGIDFYSAEEIDEKFSDESIIAERERATAAETQLQENITAEQTRAEAAEQANATAITAEQTRAENAEQANATAIIAEQTRADAAEQALDSRMTDWETNLNQTNENLTSEVSRATNAETQLNTDVTNETARATAAEQANADAISAESLRAQETERNINNALLSESERAQRVENQINTALSNESTRAQEAEQANTGAIEAEVTRAKEAEQANTGAIEAEVTRAKEAEQVNTTAIEAEVTRAKEAEQVNTTAIEAEVTRAKEAEQANTSDIEAEVTRAKAAEQALDQKVADEELRASTAESVLTQSITGLSTRVTKLNTEVETNRSHQIMTFETTSDLPSINFNSATRLKIHNGQLVYIKDAQIWYKATTTDIEGDPVTWTEYNMPTTTDKLEDYPYVVNPKPGQFRWLRFDPANKNGLVIQKGVVINLSFFGVDKTLHINVDTAFDMGDPIPLTAGIEYNVIATYNETDGFKLIAKTIPATTASDIVIGWFSTLCESVGNTYCRVRFQLGQTVTAGYTEYLVQKYDKEKDPDYYSLYNKTVASTAYPEGGTDITSGDNYIYADVDHPLNGYVAGNILPESIWCDTWRPASPRPTADRPDAMVYCANFGTAIDVYLQVGTGPQTRSSHTGAVTRSRTPKLHAMDMADVGKKLLTDHEFSCAAIGSNENTVIQGSAFAAGSVSGGHSDTDGRRIISAIGCEDMCGVLFQYLDELGPAGNNTDGWATSADSDAKFGRDYGLPYILRAGGYYETEFRDGSFSRTSTDLRSAISVAASARGSSRVIRGRA